MAVWHMKLSPAASFGLDRFEEVFLEENPGLAMAYERFCHGPARRDLLLPMEERPPTELGLPEVEQLEIWRDVVGDL